MTILKNYKISAEGVKYNLIFYTDLTIISGESGVGKTLLFKAFQKKAALGDERFVCVDINYVTNLKNMNTTLDSVLSSAKNKIIIIDNAGVVLNTTQRLKISMDTKNQYIIFTHGTDGFKTNRNGLAKLLIENNEGFLKYPLRRGN